MRAISDRARVFWTALGTHRYGLADIAKLAAVGVAAASIYWFGYKMTALEIGLAVALVVAVLLFWIMLEYALKLTRQISDARVRISQLRHEGVRIRNDALRGVSSGPKWRAWEKRVLAWKQEVEDAIAEISRADAEWFSVLDIVPPPRLTSGVAPQGLEQKFLKLFGEHDFRVCRLGEMIRDLWGRH